MKVIKNCTIVLACLSSFVCAAPDQKEGSKASLLTQSPSVSACDQYQGEALVLGDYKLERIAAATVAYGGFNIMEGPAWIDGALYYSNIGSRSDGQMQLSNQGTIWRWTPGQEPQVWLDDRTGGTNGLAVNGEGNLTVGRQLDGSISVFNVKTKEHTVLAAGYEDKRFNSPNDLTLAKDGTVYFTDPSWNTPSNVDRSTVQGGGKPGDMIPGERIYRLSPDGVVTALSVTEQVKELRDKPNGILLSLDEKQLFVSSRRGLWVFQMKGGWPVNPKQVLQTGVDGMGQDCAGNVYITTSRKLLRRADAQIVLILDPALNELGFIEVPAVQMTTNVAFGGKEGKTLFITTLGTASTEEQPQMCGPDPCLPASLFKVEMNIPGIPY